ncbi:MAG: signal peptidase I [Bacteriovoracaceae bacterium]|nr:signal peptidase I [Bacteriovoracaceae bacterium]
MSWTRKKIIKEIKSIILIIVVVFAFRSTFFEPFTIPSGSMIPTLVIGDFILVNKFSYGFKVPFSDMFWDPIYIGSFKSPERGDVVVFKYPKDKSINYIKRVVGLPGDTLEIVDNFVYINGKQIETHPHDGGKIIEDMDAKFKNYSFNFYKAKTGEHDHIIQFRKKWYATNKSEMKIPEGNYFVMGDNRDFSADSRYWGFVPEENIKGRALFVWFSMVMPWSEHPFRFRPHRIGKAVDSI